MGGGREDGEDADKEKKIKTARAVFTMTCLNLILDEINPLGFLHLDVEGWDTYALRGTGVALCGVETTCFFVYDVWYEMNRKRRHLDLRDADRFRPPYDNVLSPMAEHPNFKRINGIIDQDRNMCLRFRREEYSGGSR